MAAGKSFLTQPFVNEHLAIPAALPIIGPAALPIIGPGPGTLAGPTGWQHDVSLSYLKAR
jgi:hypothetical protein